MKGIKMYKKKLHFEVMQKNKKKITSKNGNTFQE